MPELAFFRHGEELLRVALGDQTTIGRSADCDVSLPDPSLSRARAADRAKVRGWLASDPVFDAMRGSDAFDELVAG